MRLLLMGPQGAGKGTQGERIAEKYGIPSIATGEIFRWALKGHTALGNRVKEYVEAGRLVPDDLTIEVVAERLTADDCQEGFLLDGFPRSLTQARALDVILEGQSCSLDAAITLEVPEEVSLHRLLGRRVCSDCGKNYNVDSPPEHDWICDRCGGKVVPRQDDNEDAIRERLKQYHELTEPLKEYYESKGLLRRIDGSGSVDEVFSRIVAAL